MNIQIFGTKKCFETKKTERYFKERRNKFQYIDLKEKGLSRGELTSICRAVGGIDNLLDPDCRDQDALALVKYITESQKMDTVLENQQVIKTPVVRNGKQATAGYHPEIWQEWD